MRKFAVLATATIIATGAVAPAANAASIRSASGVGIAAVHPKHHWNLNKDSKGKALAPTKVKVSGYWQVVSNKNHPTWREITLVATVTAPKGSKAEVTYFFGSPSGKIDKYTMPFGDGWPKTNHLEAINKAALADVWAQKSYRVKVKGKWKRVYSKKIRIKQGI
ncbi:hypothetical protein NE236_09830 [Actinoallomurus purpureus]|uniref:hypothetical protein n=1 Tax=Actinoallomurus purpureus TaxID=478114 RepID=UPI0020934748|nr:hypothetical protein [Actinoallomurus purpureus]MCO6005285.1 hypothetical protein [Actinoallomurus purpureus]